MLVAINNNDLLVKPIQKCVASFCPLGLQSQSYQIHPDYIGHKQCSLLIVFISSIRFDTRRGTLDCDLWPTRSASGQTDPGGRAENPASSERRQHQRGGPSPEQPHVSHAQGLPRTAAGGAAGRIVAGHLITQLEGVQHDGPAAELAQA